MLCYNNCFASFKAGFALSVLGNVFSFCQWQLLFRLLLEVFFPLFVVTFVFYSVMFCGVRVVAVFMKHR